MCIYITEKQCPKIVGSFHEFVAAGNTWFLVAEHKFRNDLGNDDDSCAPYPPESHTYWI